MGVILTLNAGSSSIKFSVFTLNGSLSLQAQGQVANIGANPQLVIDWGVKKERLPIGASDHAGVLAVILDALSPALDRRDVIGVGHRIVHGGESFTKPAVLTAAAIERLAALEPLAPLHQPQNLSGVAAAQSAFPNALQVGCFDTAFHRGRPWVSDAFALPRRYFDEGVRRYGFHGLSYQYIAQRLKEEWPSLAAGRVVVAHLGNGASMCAMRDGVSVAATMGFSALDGLPMGTRCGQLDPGVVLHLLERGMTCAELTSLLYEESGLKGLSGLSNDMQTLLASSAPEAADAVNYFTFCVRREIGGMAAILGGLDGLVFCGGIGERASVVRQQALEGLEHLGLIVDAAANQHNAPLIGAGSAPILIIPTDEERVIAEATAALASPDGVTPVPKLESNPALDAPDAPDAPDAREARA
ncbi:MAG: acetate/propionate family kinase [Pseudomonadota bacterium]